MDGQAKSSSSSNNHGNTTIGGRPTKLTAELITLICDRIRDGNFREVAVRAAGVALRTFSTWMRRGKAASPTGKKDACYRELYGAVIAAEQDAEIVMVSRIREASEQDPEHAKWWLERKFPERWGRNSQEFTRLKKQLAQMESQLTALVAVRSSAALPPPAPEPAAAAAAVVAQTAQAAPASTVAAPR